MPFTPANHQNSRERGTEEFYFGRCVRGQSEGRLSRSMSAKSPGIAFMSTRPLTEMVTVPETEPYSSFSPSHRLMTSALGPNVHPKMHWHGVTLTRSSRPCSRTVSSRPSNSPYPLTPGKAGCPHTRGSTQTIMLTSGFTVAVPCTRDGENHAGGNLSKNSSIAEFTASGRSS